MSRIAALYVAALAVALLAQPVAAEGIGGTFTFQIENDRIANTDRHYTHGTRLAWVSDKASDGPQWAKDALEWLYPLADLRAGRVGLVLGQNIFTPEDTDASGLVRDDRPYAGWLYAGISVHAETARRRNGISIDRLDSVELDVGIVGPGSFAEDIQDGYHDLIGVARSNGWDHQLDNEPGVALIFERKWRPAPWRTGALEVDLIPSAGGSLGNVTTQLNLGAMVRLGQSLDVDYGPPHVRPSLSGLAAVAPGDGLAWYLFAGVEGRAVARNIFLDGNSFADSHDVDKKPLVGDFQVGVALVWRGVRLAFTHVFRTKEFDGQRRADRYGALSLSARF
jgi:hypothetical protein